MRLIVKTVQKVIYEATLQEYKERGFDSLWDEIREMFPQQDYELHTVEKKEKIFFELKPKEK